MKKPVAWSYSRLTNFENCPKKFWHTMVQKDYKEAESEAMRYGSEVHKAIEQRISKGTEFPLHLTHLEPQIKRFADVGAKVLVEQQLALNTQMQPTGWFDSDVWCRAIIDYAAINGKRALVVDWKTGKQSDDFTQQKVAAAMFFVYFPEVETIDMMYYWLKDKKPTTDTLERQDVKHVWAAITKRVKKYTTAHETTDFPARPSGLCKRHCPVKSCPHNGA